MKTCQTFEDLQELGAEKIHERTHISRHKLELLLSKSFGDLSRLQVMGFISILEREYLLDLSSLREEYDGFVQFNPDAVMPKTSVILQAQSRTRQRWILGAILAIILLVGIGILMQSKLSNAPEDEFMQLSTAGVQVPEENITAIVDTNLTDHNVSATEQNLTQSAEPLKPLAGKSVTIKPTYNVWVGMIDMNTSVKSEKVTKDPIILENGKDTLLVFGHGKLEMNTPQGTKTMQEKNMVYFLYQNGTLSTISAAEFKAKNNGSGW